MDLNYREFRDELLMALARYVRGDTSRYVDTDDLTLQVPEKFRPSWPTAAAQELAGQGLVKAQQGLDGIHMCLTGAGLAKAEEYAESVGADLYDEDGGGEPGYLVDDTGAKLSDENGNLLVLAPDASRAEIVSSRVIPVNRNEAPFKELDDAMRDVVASLRRNNQLMNNEGPEASQRLAEVEAGRRLFDADQANAGLIERLMIPALKWLGTKVREEVTKIAIQKLISLLTLYLGINVF